MKYLYSFNSHSDFYNKGMVLEDDNVVLCKDTDINKWHGHYQHPPYDAEVEYLESTGTQWIDTEFKHDQNTRFVAKFEVLNTSFNQSRYIDPFGSWGDVKASSGTNYGKMKGIENNPSNGHWSSYYGLMSKAKALNTAITRNGIHTIDFNKNVHTMDGYSITHDAQTFTSKYNDVIFGVTNYNGIGNCGGCFRFFYFKIYDNGILVRNFIPVRIGNKGYMYDKVSDKLFGNAGTGNFTLGPDIQPIEYLESTGTQYINTKLIHSVSNYEYYIDFTPSENENNTVIFGSSKSNYWDGQSWSTSNNLYIGSSTLSGKGFGRQANVRETIRLIVNGNKIIGYKNGTKYLNTTFNGTIISGYQILLFAYTFGNNNASGLCKAKVHSFYIIMNNKKVFHGVPVRVGNVGYMYDRISGQLFGNAGTGSFILGNDL